MWADTKQTGDRKTPYNRGLNARQAEVLNSAFVLLFGFSTKLNICASNPALRQAPDRWLIYFESSPYKIRRIS
jgi:hypothetical protein